MNPYSGKAWVIASGFLGATNLAIGKHGEIYVAELLRRKHLGRQARQEVRTTSPCRCVVAVETEQGRLAVGRTRPGNEAPPAPGTIVKISKGKAYKQASIRR